MRTQRFQQTLRSALALAVLSCPAAAVQAADCPAGDYPSLVACAAGATAGDTITLSANIAATATPPLVVPVNVSLVNAGFAISGTLAKSGPGTLTMNSGNSLSGVIISAGTISIGVNNALGTGGGLQMSGGRLLSTGNLNPTFGSIAFAAGTNSTIAALTGGQIAFLGAAITLDASATANLGDAGNTGNVFIAPSGLSSADPTSMIRVGGNLVMGNLNASLLTAQASSVTLDISSGISSNGNPIEIGNLQGTTIFTGINVAGPTPQPLTIRGGSFKGTVNGNGFINKIGPGTLILGGQVLHTGGTIITSGTLQFGDGDGTNYSLSTNVTNGGTLAFDTGGTITMNGQVSATGGVVKNGPGTVVLANPSNSYGGNTRINQGRLRITSATALGNGSTIEMNGGALEAGSTAFVPKTINFIAGVNTICAAFTQTLTLAGDLQGDSSETRFGDCGAGTVELAGFPSLDPGALSINGNSTLLVSAGFSGGNLFRLATSTTINAPATLRLDSPVPVRIFNLQGNGTLTVAQSEMQIDIGSFDGVIEGAGALRQLSFSTGLTLRGNNTYTGNTFVQGSMTVGDGGFSGSLGPGEISQSGLLTFNRADGIEIPNFLSGLGSIEFRGGGTFTLSGTGFNAGNFRPLANTTLVVTGTYLQGRPQLNGSGAVLRGTGTVQGFLASIGGFVEPGVNGTTGILTADQPLIYGATFRVKVNGPIAGTGHDQLRALSLLNFQSNPPLVVTGTYLPAPGEVFTIVDIGGAAPAGGGTFAGLAEGALLPFGAGQLRISYSGGTGNDITLTAVAPPSAPIITTATLASTTSATVTFMAPGSDGASPILDYTAQCGAQSVTGAGSPLVVTGLPAGPTTCVVRARNAVGTSPNSAALSITPGNFTFSGPSPTGTGTISTTLSGGGGACQFSANPSYIPVEGDQLSPPAGTAPSDIEFPHGLFAFAASGCTPGSTLTVETTYPTPIPAGATYVKYGPRPGDPVASWYVLGATIAGNVVTFNIIDGGLGDSDVAANGSIVDPGGIALPKAVVVDSPLPDFTGIAFQGLWWAGAAESGWGVNTTHQGDILFATWFTYDANEDGQWLVMPNAQRILPGTYDGKIFVTRGPAFDAVPFDPRLVERLEVGEGTFQFTSASEGTFIYTLNGIRQAKRVTRQTFGNLIPECRSVGQPSADRNYQDLWWNPAESGWGLNLTHQGNVIFATWFTYNRQGKGQWLVMSNLARVGTTETFTGTIYRTEGNPFNAVPWDPATIDRIEVGTATLSFSSTGEGTFLYTLDGVTMTKAITRQEFASPKAICRY